MCQNKSASTLCAKKKALSFDRITKLSNSHGIEKGTTQSTQRFGFTEVGRTSGENCRLPIKPSKIKPSQLKNNLILRKALSRRDHFLLVLLSTRAQLEIYNHGSSDPIRMLLLPLANPDERGAAAWRDLQAYNWPWSESLATFSSK